MGGPATRAGAALRPQVRNYAARFSALRRLFPTGKKRDLARSAGVEAVHFQFCRGGDEFYRREFVLVAKPPVFLGARASDGDRPHWSESPHSARRSARARVLHCGTVEKGRGTTARARNSGRNASAFDVQSQRNLRGSAGEFTRMRAWTFVVLERISRAWTRRTERVSLSPLRSCSGEASVSRGCGTRLHDAWRSGNSRASPRSIPPCTRERGDRSRVEPDVPRRAGSGEAGPVGNGVGNAAGVRSISRRQAR